MSNKKGIVTETETETASTPLTMNDVKNVILQAKADGAAVPPVIFTNKDMNLATVGGKQEIANYDQDSVAILAMASIGLRIRNDMDRLTDRAGNKVYADMTEGTTDNHKDVVEIWHHGTRITTRLLSKSVGLFRVIKARTAESSTKKMTSTEQEAVLEACNI